jgi:PAS domain S-box-containing protein
MPHEVGLRFLFFIMPTKLTFTTHWLVRYGAAVAAAGVGLLIRWALEAWVGPGLPSYITFYPAVMAVALLAGFGPGLAATALAALAVDYWIIPPVGFGVDKPVDAVGLGFFSGMGLFMSLVAEYSRRAQQKATTYDRQAAVRESQARLAAFAEATFEGIVESDAGRIVDCNEQFARMSGYSVEELRGVQIASLIASEDQDRVMANVQQGRESVTEHAMLRKDGTRMVVETHGRPVSQGSARRHTAVRDITVRKEAEEALRTSEERHRLLAETMVQGVVHQDADGKIIAMNPAAERILGKSREQFLGSSSVQEEHHTIRENGERFPGQQHPSMMALRSGQAVRDVIMGVFNPKLGDYRWISIGAVPVCREGETRPSEVYAVFEDITERKRAEAAVLRLNSELRQRVADLQAANEEVQASRRAALSVAEEAMEARQEAERAITDLQKANESLNASRRAALNLMDDAVRARAQAEQASAELRSVAEQRRLALEAADLGAWEFHFQTGTVFWDERCREMWGIPRGEKIDYGGAIAAIDPEYRAGVDEAVKQALAGKDAGAYHREFRVAWPDSSVHWIASHGRVYFQGEGDQRRPIRFIGVNREVTAEKQAVEAVRQSEERYRGLVELSPEAVFVNRNDRIVLVNPAGLQLFGASSAEQLLGKSPFEVFHPDYHAVMRERIDKLLAGQRAPLLEEKIVRLDGVPVDVEVVATPVMDQGEGAILVLLRDITERKRAQAALQQTAAELERSNRDLEQFAYVASHDLQEPLRAVGGYVKLLEHRFPDKLDAKAQRYITGAFDGAARMERLILDLLAFSRVGTRGGNFVPTDMEVVLNQALGNLQAGIETSRAKLTRDPLPTLAVDATQMMQLFQNLVGNALKFRGESPPSIHVGARRQDGRWWFSVRDNGIGIEPQYFGKIFQVFQRLHTRKDYPGTGIGLAICKKIVERHGGSIWVESQPGQGATFNFTIPGAAR